MLFILFIIVLTLIFFDFELFAGLLWFAMSFLLGTALAFFLVGYGIFQMLQSF